jgi:hypothetical protein
VDEMATGRTKRVECCNGGWRAVVYEDDDGGSGYGNHAKIGYWFGTREACADVGLYDIFLDDMRPDDRPDDFDLACERRYD